MSSTVRLSASELWSGLRSISEVVADHAAALDRLDGVEPEVTDPDQPAPVGPAPVGSDLAAILAGAVERARGAPDMARLWNGVCDGAAAASSGPGGAQFVTLLRGMAEVLRNADHLDAPRFALALEVAAEAVAPADDGAHAGTLPAVVAAAATGALAAVDDGGLLADAVIAAADDGLAELEDGPRSNEDLATRGVVDAAAAGFLLVLDVLASVVTGEPLPAPPPDAPVLLAGAERFAVSCTVEPHPGNGLEASDWLESTWHELGDLRRFDRSDGRWQVELLTPLPGAAVEALFEVGRPRELHIGVADVAR
jgi:hypothetical protein